MKILSSRVEMRFDTLVTSFVDSILDLRLALGPLMVDDDDVLKKQDLHPCPFHWPKLYFHLHPPHYNRGQHWKNYILDNMAPFLKLEPVEEEELVPESELQEYYDLVLIKVDENTREKRFISVLRIY